MNPNEWAGGPAATGLPPWRGPRERDNPGPHAPPPRQDAGKRRGFLLPLVILGILSLAFLIFFVSSLGSNYQTQVAHEEESLRCRVIGESVLSMVVARIRNATWKARFFSPKPFREEGVLLFNGSYSLYVVDSPGVRDQVDIYVEARCRRARKLFFWRFKYERSLLDIAGRLRQVLFQMADADGFPKTGADSPFAGTVENLIKERQENEERVQTKVGALAGVGGLADVLNILDGPQENILIAQDPTSPGNLPPITPPSGLPPSPGTGTGTGSGSGAGTDTGTGGGSDTGTGGGTGSGTGTGTDTGTGTGTGTGTSGDPGTSPPPPNNIEPVWPPRASITGHRAGWVTIDGVRWEKHSFVLDGGTEITLYRPKIQVARDLNHGKVNVQYEDGTSETFPP